MRISCPVGLPGSGKRGVIALGECLRIGGGAGADDDSEMSALGSAMEADEIKAVKSRTVWSGDIPVVTRRGFFVATGVSLLLISPA